MSETELSVRDQSPLTEQPGGALRDLQTMAMSAPVEVMQQGLAIWKERNDTFRHWLFDQMQEGVHYGHVPGTEPKYTDATKTVVSVKQWDKRSNNGRGGYVVNNIPTSQWKPRKALYQAGADLVCQVLNIDDKYDADMATFEQLGKPEGTAVQRCRLYRRATGELIGEGIGAYKIGEKGADANRAIKGAMKRAKVDAVLKAFALRDLFQDEVSDDDAKQPFDNPEMGDAPQNVPERAHRETRKVTAEMFTRLKDRWKELFQLPMETELEVNAAKEKFVAYCVKHADRQFDAGRSSQWTWADFERVEKAVMENLL